MENTIKLPHKIYFCDKCNQYTMEEKHCNKKTLQKKPAKFSPTDKYSKYRNIYKSKQ